MEPKIIKTEKYIEFVGHYDDITKCAKLSALATLWSIEAKHGYIKFPIEYEEQINKVLECDKLYAGLNSLGLRTYTTNTSSLLYNYKLNKTFSNNWVVNSNTNFNGKWGNYIWYDGEYYNCFINYPLANYRYVNGVWSTYNNGYTSIPGFTGQTVFYTKNNTFFGNGNNNGNGWYKFENGAFVKKASNPDWRKGYYTWTDGTKTYHDGLGGNSGTTTCKQYMQWVFNESNCTWSTKAWTNLTSSQNVFNVWTDGDNIYLSQGSTQLVLNKATSTWESKSWSGLSSFTGEDVWTDGHDIYYSANSKHYVLDKKTSTWNRKTWTGLTSFDGRNTWTDGVNLYYSVNEKQYILEQVEVTPLTKTYNLDAFSNNSEDFNQIIVNGTSIDRSTFNAIDNIHYLNTNTSSNITVYSNESWASNYDSILDYITTAPNVTTINSDCNSIVTFTTHQVEPAIHPISIGTLPLSASYIGTSEVDKIFYGTSLVYKKQISFTQKYLTNSGDYSLLSDMQQDKIYTIYFSYADSSTLTNLSVIAYSNGTWQSQCISGSYLVISSQTRTSVNIYFGDNHLDSRTSQYIILEGDAQATTSDFEGYTQTAGLAYWRCFVEGTKISLANGTTKNVEDITYDDDLLVWNFYEGKLDSAKPKWIMNEKIATEYKSVLLSDNTELKLVGSNEKCHRLFNVTKQQMLYANECVGDEVYKQDDSIVQVVSCIPVEQEVKFYNLTTEKYLDCFANGVLTGSRLNNMYHITNMKYDSDERLISKEEEAERWAVRESAGYKKC